MRYPIEFSIDEIEEGNPDAGYTLMMRVMGFSEVELQTGYPAIGSALQALRDCLTTPAPDLAYLEDSIGRVGETIDRVTNLEEAMTVVGGRLNEAEEKLEGIASPTLTRMEAQPGAGLLPIRRGATTPQAVQPHRPAPAIRRRVAEEDMVPHQPVNAGAFVPGRGEV